MYMEQIEGGRYFLHEHPSHATSWALPSVQRIASLPGVIRTDADQCQYGAEVKQGKQRGDPIKTPTGFLTNPPRGMRSACLNGAQGDWVSVHGPQADSTTSVPEYMLATRQFILDNFAGRCSKGSRRK